LTVVTTNLSNFVEGGSYLVETSITCSGSFTMDA
jgi:hypothetical protein